MAAAAELPLDSCRFRRYKGALAVLCLHESTQLRLAHLRFELRVRTLPRARAAVGIFGMLGNAYAEFSEVADPLLLSALMQSRSYNMMLFVFLALFGRDLKPAFKKLLRTGDYLFGGHVRRKLKLVQKLPVVCA